MSNQLEGEKSIWLRPNVLVVASAILLVGALLVWWAGAQTDNHMREDLLRETQGLTQALDMRHIQSLSGTDADLDLPDYEGLKEQLVNIRSANRGYRFVYLMGRKDDGLVFFFVDSEPPASEGYSPPGQIYGEVSPEVKSVFENRAAAVEALDTDRWGTWVSGLAPIVDPASDRVVAVLGIDIDARGWRWKVVSSGILPALLIIVLLIVVASTVSTVATTPSPAQLFRRSRYISVTALAGFLMITGTTTWYIYSIKHRMLEQSFDARCEKTRQAISDRLDDHARILLSGAALFDASERVTREIWRVYNQSQQIDRQLPGIEGIGFVLLIPRTELERHVEEIRGEGFPAYAVKPEGDREVYTSIIYLEPFSGRNLRAFGYDMFSEPVCHQAMVLARDTGSAALSGKVRLIQETDEDIQPGTLMYTPVYRKGLPIDSIEERRSALYGWVCSPYRMNDRFQGILDAPNYALAQDFHIQIFDGDGTSPENMLFGSLQSEKERFGEEVDFTRQMSVTFKGRRWTLCFSQVGGGILAVDFIAVWLALIGGALLSLLLSFVIRVMLNTHAEARRMAQQLTVELRESEESYRNQFTKNTSKMLLVDPDDGAIVAANPAAMSFYGYSREQFLAMQFSNISTRSAQEVLEDMASVSQNDGKRFSFQHRLSDGSVRDVEVSSSRILFAGRMLLHSIIHDITERKQAENALRESEALHRTLLASLSAGVIIVDADTHVIESANPAAAHICGAPASEMVGRVCHQFLCPAQVGNCPVADMGMELENADREVLRYDGTRVSVLKSVKHIQIAGKDKFLELFVDITERKAIEGSLRLLEMAVQDASDAVVITTADLDLPGPQILYVNPAFATISGYTPEEATGKTPRMLQGPQTHPGFRARLRATLARGETFEGETVNRRKDGGLYSVELHISPVRDSKGVITRFVAIQRDVTSRYDFVKLLRQKQELIGALSHAQTEYIKDSDPRIAFGYLLEQTIAITSSEYGFIGELHRSLDGSPYLKTHAMTNIAWNEDTRRLYDENAQKGFEFRNMKTLFGATLTDGVTVISNNPSKDPRAGGLPSGHPEMRTFIGLPFLQGDEVVGMLGLANRSGGYDEALVEQLQPLIATCTSLILSHRNVLERRAITEELRESVSRIRNILDTVMDGIITIDEEGIIQVVNPAAARIFGYPAEMMLGRNISIIMPGPFNQIHDMFILRYLKTGEKHVLGVLNQVQAIRANGEIFFAELALSELLVSGRRFFTGVIRDISGRMRTENELKESREQELKLRQRIQETLLFGKVPKTLRGLSVGGASFPSDYVDGDFYEFYEGTPDCLDVVLGDIMGKGTVAALLGAAVKNHFLRALNQLIPGLHGRLPDPADIVNQAHSIVTPELSRPGIDAFVTLFYARFDLNARTCTFVDCGHTKTIHLHMGEDRCRLLQGDNVPIGVLPQEHYEQYSTEFASGDIFVLYSDGITEARNTDRAYFGVEGIERVALQCRHRSSGEIVMAIIDRVSQFVRGSGLSDDATCLVVKIAPKETARYQLTTTLDQMGTVRSHIHAFCASLPDAEEVILRVQLGVVETLTNVIKHAFKFEEDHVVELTMETYSDRVCVRLDYDGPFFEPDVASLPNPKDMVESGYGLYIVEQCFDQVEYFVAEDRRSAVLMTRTFCVK